MGNNKASFRTRNWVSILYPESAKENWEEILSETHVPALVSPLHDKDVSANGEPKKPHYHVILMFQGNKTTNQAQEIFDSIGAIKCEAVKDIRGSCRYFCHLDDRNKAEYSPDDVKSFSGADYMSIISLVSDKYKAIGEMMDWCDQQDCWDYSDLLRYARSEKQEWFRCLCDNSTMVIKEFMKSEEHKRKRMIEESGAGVGAMRPARRRP